MVIHVCYLLVLKTIVSFITTNISSNGYVIMELIWCSEPTLEHIKIGTVKKHVMKETNNRIVKDSKTGQWSGYKIWGHMQI